MSFWCTKVLDLLIQLTKNERKNKSLAFIFLGNKLYITSIELTKTNNYFAKYLILFI